MVLGCLLSLYSAELSFAKVILVQASEQFDYPRCYTDTLGFKRNPSTQTCCFPEAWTLSFDATSSLISEQALQIFE